MKSSRLVHSLVVAAATFLCSTPALADPAAASRYYEDALRRYDDGDAAGAIVQLNNALREDGNMLAGRLLLARAYLRSGELGAAEVADDLTYSPLNIDAEGAYPITSPTWNFSG